jgi:tape measure domain-containing protein
MQNSDLTITVKAVGIPEAQAQLEKLGATMKKLTVNQNGTVSATGKLTKAADDNADATGRAADATDRASKSQLRLVGHIAETTILSAGVNQLFLQFVDVAGQAIRQVDLMNNFPTTMASMGQATGDATGAFQVLSDYVGQVGGNIGDATSAVTRFTGVTKDVKAAVAVYTGLNNALIAGDSTLEEQRLSAIQFAQAFERGKPDMKEWLSLTQNMSFQLAQVAKEMGFVNATALGESLRAGETSMADFTTKLTQLSTGTGPIAQQAIARMNGIQFSFNVMKNTMVQGLAAIINTIGRQNIISFFTFLTQVIQVLTSVVVTLIGWIVSLLNILGGLFGLPAIKLIDDTKAVADNLGAGAGAAGDLGEGLQDAKKDAKELNKSLASFDKMNVLADKTSGKDKEDTAGKGTEFSTDQIGALGDVFADITPNLQEASKWAKIFAGILAGLAASGILGKIFGTSPLRAFGDALSNNVIKPLGKGIKNAATNASKSIGDFSKGLGKGLLSSSSTIKEAELSGAVVGDSIKDGLKKTLSGVNKVFKTALLNPLVAAGRSAIITIVAIIGSFAATLGIPFSIAAIVVAAAVATIIGIVWLIATNWDAVMNAIKTALQATWNFIVAVWSTLYEIFRGPVTLLWQIFSSIFILIVAIISTALELILKLVVGTVKLIFDVLVGVASWIFDNVIKPIGEFFAALWRGIIDGVVSAWNWIFQNVLLPVATWINVNVITPIVDFFRAMWNTISGFAGGFFNNIKNFLSPVVSWIKINIIDKIANFFSSLWDGVKNGLSSMIEGIKSLFGGVADVFKTPINGIIDLINNVLKSLNNTVKVPDWVPGLGGKGVNFPMIPRLNTGGVVMQDTLAMLHKSSDEAVLPLEGNDDWIDRLASKLNTTNQNTNPDIIPVTNRKQEASNVININVSGVFATSTAEQKKVAELIAKQLNNTLRAKGLKGAY